MTTKQTEAHGTQPAAEPLALSLHDLLGLVERLRTDVLWHQRRGNDTIARDCQEAADMLARLEHEAAFYRRRVQALEQWQSRMRDPERTVVCDILANGFTLDPPVPRDRYELKA